MKNAPFTFSFGCGTAHRQALALAPQRICEKAVRTRDPRSSRRHLSLQAIARVFRGARDGMAADRTFSARQRASSGERPIGGISDKYPGTMT
jgi:hypothetical protein